MLKALLLMSIGSLLATRLRVHYALLCILVLTGLEVSYFVLVHHHTPGRALGIFGTLNAAGQFIYLAGAMFRWAGSLGLPFVARRP